MEGTCEGQGDMEAEQQCKCYHSSMFINYSYRCLQLTNLHTYRNTCKVHLQLPPHQCRPHLAVDDLLLWRWKKMRGKQRRSLRQRQRLRKLRLTKIKTHLAVYAGGSKSLRQICIFQLMHHLLTITNAVVEEDKEQESTVSQDVGQGNDAG